MNKKHLFRIVILGILVLGILVPITVSAAQFFETSRVRVVSNRNFEDVQVCGYNTQNKWVCYYGKNNNDKSHDVRWWLRPNRGLVVHQDGNGRNCYVSMAVPKNGYKDGWVTVSFSDQYCWISNGR